MKLLDNYDPIVNDDIGFTHPRLYQVPDGFGFGALTKHNDCPLTNNQWNKFVSYASRYYRHFEIVGRTYTDFQENLQLAYDAGADTMERLLEVYNDDIAKPILGRTEITSYDLHDNDTEKSSTKDDNISHGSDNNTNEGQTENIDVPINSDNPNTQVPSTVDKSKTTTSGTVDTTDNRTINYNTEKNHGQIGTVKTELSDLGVRPNYETLNGFLDNNRTDVSVFVWLFRDCFAINDVMIW